VFGFWVKNGVQPGLGKISQDFAKNFTSPYFSPSKATRGDRMRDPRQSKSSGGLGGSELAGIGIQFAVTILVFTGAGIWLDRRLGTSPWLLLVCVFAGAGGGFFSIYRKAMAAQRRDQARKDQARQGERQ
jgi:F0F1-type ATP synthase assembly protein I